MNEQDSLRKERFAENKPAINESLVDKKLIKADGNSKDEIAEKVKDKNEIKKVSKTQPEIN